MRKTSVYLTDEDQERLEQLARREGKPQAEIIREALRLYASRPRPRRVFRMAASGDGPGGSIADIPEEEYLEGFGE